MGFMMQFPAERLAMVAELRSRPEPDPLHRGSQRLAGRPVVCPWICRLKRQVLPRSGDGPLRTALQLGQSHPSPPASTRPGRRAPERKTRAAVVAPCPLRRKSTNSLPTRFEAALGHEAREDRAREVLHHRLREALDRLVVEARRDRHHDVQALSATGLQPGLEPQFRAIVCGPGAPPPGRAARACLPRGRGRRSCDRACRCSSPWSSRCETR